MILKNNVGRSGIGVSIAVTAIAICFFCLWAGGRSEDSVSASAASISSSPDPAASAWEIEALDDPYTGVMTNIAMDILDGNNSVVIRGYRGRFECYINTGKFIGTGGLNNGRAVVRYRFDDGKTVRQTWKISSDNQALIYPGNPAEFLRQFAAAKTLTFEFTPANASAQSILYNVTGLPIEFQ